MIRTFRYRLYPNVNQSRELATMLETHRRLYNHCLEMKTMAWECDKTNISYFDFCKWFKNIRQGNRYFSALNVDSARTVFWRLDQSFKSFFRRVKAGQTPGYPRFKGKNCFNSVWFQTSGHRLTNNKLQVFGIGNVTINLHRPIYGEVKSMVLHNEAGKWFACFACKLPSAMPSTNANAAGIDIGLASFLTASDGTAEPNPKYLKTALPAIRRAARAVARKKRGGANRRKAVRVLQTIHARVRNLRREHHHQVGVRLVRRYGFIAAERLNIQGMIKNRRLSRAISDVAWGGFINILRAKAESAGVQFVEVDPKGTSQECSQCGAVVAKELSERQHNCPHCGLSLDRDHNAALNILARARQAGTPPACDNVGHKAKRRARSGKLPQVT